ncbi:MAG: type II restriction endonuclease [Candidatus Kapaibacteriales bacterium]
MFLTCKRTLRERWKQEVPQARINQRIYLLTLDDSLSISKANEINQKRLIAFVGDEIAEMENFNTKPWIRKLSDLLKGIRGICNK